MSEYNQSLAEAKPTNRMSEALELFRSVCNNQAFSNTGKSIMLFLNKKDIFGEKINYTDISAQNPFSDYAGPSKDFNSGVMYFIQKFKDCLIDDNFNDSFIHVTCATDTNNMEFVLDTTRSIIMSKNLRQSGFRVGTKEGKSTCESRFDLPFYCRKYNFELCNLSLCRLLYKQYQKKITEVTKKTKKGVVSTIYSAIP
jgi:hypothetical protein